MARPKLYNQLPENIFCRQCDSHKRISEFYKEKRSSSGYQTKCKDCLKSYYAKNRENYQKLKNKNPEYAKKMREYYLSHKTQINDYKRKRYQTEDGRLKVLAINHKRRAQKISTCDGTVTHSAIKRLLVNQKYKCAISGKDLTEYDVDHIVPLSKNGKHTITNIQIVLPSINRSKKDKILW